MPMRSRRLATTEHVTSAGLIAQKCCMSFAVICGCDLACTPHPCLTLAVPPALPCLIPRAVPCLHPHALPHPPALHCLVPPAVLCIPKAYVSTILYYIILYYILLYYTI
jgi:hypothetical protein